MIQQRIGWRLPVDALKWWVRGLAAPGKIDHQIIDAEGQLINLQQNGWTVKFSRYDLTNGVVLPKRLNATKDNYRVKLAISRWRMDSAHAVIN